MNKKSWIIAAICLVIGVLLGVGMFMAVNFFKKPIDQPLAIQTTTPSESASAEPIEEKPTDEVAAEEQAEPELEKVCGNTGAMTILLTGADATGGNPPFGADAIRIMKADFSNETVDVLTISRDLVVELNGAAPENQGEKPIGEAFYFEQQAIGGSEKEKVEIATNFLAQTLVDNLNLESHHYVTIQLSSVMAMVDAIGGVEIELPEEIVSERNVVFPAGKQTLDGVLATEFLRTKLPGGDSARQQRQNLFLDAFQDQVISTKTIRKAPELFQQFEQAITTDFSPKLIADLACLMERVTPENTNYHAIPGEFISFDEEEELMTIVNKAGLLTYIEELFD